MSSTLRTCKQITADSELDNLYEHYLNGFLYMAMTDYPYASSFLNPMPAWPVNVSCEAWKDFNASDPITPGTDTLSDGEIGLLNMLKNSSDVYFNSSGQSKCTD